MITFVLIFGNNRMAASGGSLPSVADRLEAPGKPSAAGALHPGARGTDTALRLSG